MSKEDVSIDQDDIQRALVDLAGLEKEFEQVDVDILRETTLRQAPLFARRNALTSQIRNFWPLAFEQASSTLAFDEYITLEDAHLIGKFLTGINVTRPDAATEPRTVLIEFAFAENDYFGDAVLRKKFVYQPGGSGLCSEPVAVGWREGKDLTEGVTAAAVAAWEERKAVAGKGKGKGGKGRGRGEKEARLERMMASGPSSFFNWFLWTGSHEALGEVHEHGECDGKHEHGHEDDEGPVEVFPNGEEMALQIAEDLYPNAPKYFTDSLDDEGDEDEEEDIDLESDMDEDDVAAVLASVGKKGKRNGEEEDGPAKKKSRK